MRKKRVIIFFRVHKEREKDFIFIWLMMMVYVRTAWGHSRTRPLKAPKGARLNGIS
jgi:hypothetical protein